MKKIFLKTSAVHEECKAEGPGLLPPNCTVHIQYQQRVSQKATHPFLMTEGSSKSCIMVTALLLNILGLPFATRASCHPEAG